MTTMLTVALASAVPLRAGVLSLVLWSPNVPVSLVVASAPVPAAGVPVSSVKLLTVGKLCRPLTAEVRVVLAL